jgi:hypothetical protein
MMPLTLALICQITVTTGMSTAGKISAGITQTAVIPGKQARSAST